MALAGTFGDWVTFPLSPPLSAQDLELPVGADIVPVSIALPCLLVASALAAPFSRLTGRVLLVSALVLLILVPLQLAGFEPGWLETYLVESSARADLGGYLHEQFVPNRSPEPSYVAVYGFDGLAEQLTVGWVMLGWGYYVTAAAAGALLIVLCTPRRLWENLLASAALLCLFLLAAGWDAMSALLRAERAYARGDELLALGNASGALESYAEALERNPPLRLSPSFLRKVSACYAGQSLVQDPLGKLEGVFDVAGQKKVAPKTRSSEAHETIRELEAAAVADATSVDGPLIAAAQQLESQLWSADGRFHASARRFAQALGSYAQAREGDAPLVVFYRVHAQLALGDPDPAIALLPGMAEAVGHPAFRADILCTLGDAYSMRGDLTEARERYLACREADRVDNFRALRALSGS